MSIIKRSPIGLLTRYAERLRFPQLALLTAVLFVADLLVPDMIPLVDEILLGLGTLLFARWRKARSHVAAEPRDPQ